MTPPIVLALSLAGVCSDDPVPRYKLTIPPSIQGLPKIDEAFHRQHLQRARNSRALLEANIELFEKMLKDHPDIFHTEKGERLRRDIEEWREEVEKRKKYEQELERYEKQREQNPGRETDLEAIERLVQLHQKLWPVYPIAPLPREVKR